jgi:hypothetical protein
MLAVIICERFGWTLDEYEKQPWRFIESIITMIQAEAEEQARQQKKSRIASKGTPA